MEGGMGGGRREGLREGGMGGGRREGGRLGRREGGGKCNAISSTTTVTDRSNL